MEVHFQTFQNSMLQGVFDSIWSIRSKKVPPQLENEHTIIPDCSCDIIINLGDGFIKKYGNEYLSVNKSIIVGQKLKTMSVKQIGLIDVIGIRINPYSLHSILHDYPSQLTEKSIYIDEIFGRSVDELHSQLMETHSFNKRKRIVEDYFLKRILFKDSKYERIVQSAISLISAENQVSVNNLCDSLNLSQKKLNRAFRSIVGISTKQFIQINRISTILSMPESFLESYLDFKFYDQAHFFKNFKKITGESPKKFLSNLKTMNYLFS